MEQHPDGVKRRGNPAWRKGGAEYRPANGAGWGGAKTGGKWDNITVDNQPAPEAKAAGQVTKAMMIARLAEKRMAVADKLIGLMEGAESEQTQLAAANAILDRLDGKPAQAITGPDGGEQVTRIVYGWATKPGG